MKTILFLLVLTFSFTIHAQKSLRDALYGGQLKNDTGLVVSKNDFKDKIDTSAERKAMIKAKADAEKAYYDSVNRVPEKDEVVGVTKERAKKNVSNWKEFVEELQGIIQTEVLPSPKVKNGNYSVLIDYEIGLTGEVSVSSVKSDPSNSFMENKIKEIIIYEAPKFTPELNAQGKPRIAKKKQLLSLKK